MLRLTVKYFASALMMLFGIGSLGIYYILSYEVWLDGVINDWQRAIIKVFLPPVFMMVITAYAGRGCEHKQVKKTDDR